MTVLRILFRCSLDPLLSWSQGSSTPWRLLKNCLTRLVFYFFNFFRLVRRFYLIVSIQIDITGCRLIYRVESLRFTVIYGNILGLLSEDVWRLCFWNRELSITKLVFICLHKTRMICNILILILIWFHKTKPFLLQTLALIQMQHLCRLILLNPREQLLLISLDYNFRLIRWQICCFHVAAVRLILLVWSSKLR
jgi:hypothetical protein